ncbi:MAG: GNAT family N-acyltransferase [Prolixibacteraceae bacterium]|jgi:putative hemolysin|nr:GNAT family N-acyltransferase [Bacteroidota bacterium]NLT00237.1 lysophospholipid acyltransferase family protein [Bacteroidales bacterium]OQB80480.1 MAG: Acyltransferase [Bacteroidetes bacterium ADurb.Bin123]HNZ69341.1 GNAT family N-acyltransferase [Prolixibacteraceae bacterium]HOC87712.1 GNAT family N-acyltransferase [Prolixibacteraceae bacterium]
MDLVKPKDLLKAKPGLTYFGGEYFARFLMHVLRFRKLNKLYGRIEKSQGLQFIDEVIAVLELKVDLDDQELRRIPSTGAAIVVANHPLGGLDGLLMIHYVSQIRSDIKILANHLLKKIEPVSGFFVDTNPFELDADTEESAFAGLKESMAHLKNGGILCIFPAGETSTYDASNLVTDRIWRFPVIKFIKKMNVPVVPVLFQSGNSRLFRIMGRIHPALQEARLPSELFHKRYKNVRIRVGNPIKPVDQEAFTDIYQYGRYLRAKTYGMSTPIEVKRFFNYSLIPPARVSPVVDPVPRELLLKELQDIRHRYLLFKHREYNVFAAPSREIPQILTEIGRLREVTFREVGEGTNQSIDIDEFDLYYHQLFIWDELEEKIVGAYRVGMGREIMEQYGKRGFYLNTLFRIDDNISSLLSQSLELGRSFVVKEYQRKPMPLFLLWKGILCFLMMSPENRYLIGPVSISNNYSRISKDLIIRFIMENHYDWHLAQYIKPRNSYKFRSGNTDINVLMESTKRDINKLDKTIGDVDAMNSGLPVLLKKYIKLNAKIVSFNVDPKFNNCLDGLIVLDVFDVPRETISSLLKEVNDGSILERFYSNRE